MEREIRKTGIDFVDLKKEAKDLITSEGKDSVGIDRFLMALLLCVLPIGVTQGVFNVLTRTMVDKYEKFLLLIVMCFVQSFFAIAFYLNIINMIKRGKIKIGFPLTSKTFIITFATQIVGYYLGSLLWKGNVLSIAICIGVSFVVMVIGAAIIYVIEKKECGIVEGIIISVELVFKNIDDIVKMIIMLLPIILLSIVTFGIVFIIEVVYIQTVFFLVIDKLMGKEEGCV
ncbi:hypothetical protein [uncultured Clostridium sp.]|uniref:hypothetical protein n=1 Tax=uncultured Clostridium sp. TaxID=59620 RepID=UPI00261A78CE|nr:hypothetical protein [uncultured Clostridium sp.]